MIECHFCVSYFVGMCTHVRVFLLCVCVCLKAIPITMSAMRVLMRLYSQFAFDADAFCTKLVHTFDSLRCSTCMYGTCTCMLYATTLCLFELLILGQLLSLSVECLCVIVSQCTYFAYMYMYMYIICTCILHVCVYYMYVTCTCILPCILHVHVYYMYM